MTVGKSPDGALIIRGDKHELDKLIGALRDAVLYGEAITVMYDDDGLLKIRIFKEKVVF